MCVWQKKEKKSNKMLIACKCLNITLKLTANNSPSAMPITASISNYDDSAFKTNASNVANQVHMVSSSVHNQREYLEDNHEDQPPFIQCSTAEHLDTNQLQFFRTVNIHLFDCSIKSNVFFNLLFCWVNAFVCVFFVHFVSAHWLAI